MATIRQGRRSSEVAIRRGINTFLTSEERIITSDQEVHGLLSILFYLHLLSTDK